MPRASRRMPYAVCVFPPSHLLPATRYQSFAVHSGVKLKCHPSSKRHLAHARFARSDRRLLSRAISGLCRCLTSMLPAPCSMLHAHPMREVIWIPSWLGEWADRNGNFRNFPVFAAFAALFFFVVTFYQRLVTRYDQWQLAFGAFLATALLGILLEAAQLLLPHRWADPMDIVWSSLGAFVGALVAWLVARFVSVC